MESLHRQKGIAGARPKYGDRGAGAQAGLAVDDHALPFPFRRLPLVDPLEGRTADQGEAWPGLCEGVGGNKKNCQKNGSWKHWRISDVVRAHRVVGAILY